MGIWKQFSECRTSVSRWLGEGEDASARGIITVLLCVMREEV